MTWCQNKQVAFPAQSAHVLSTTLTFAGFKKESYVIKAGESYVTRDAAALAPRRPLSTLALALGEAGLHFDGAELRYLKCLISLSPANSMERWNERNALVTGASAGF